MEEVEIGLEELFIHRPIEPFHHAVDPGTSGVGKYVLDIVFLKICVKISQKLQPVVCLDLDDRYGIYQLEFLEEVHGVLTVQFQVRVGKRELHPHINGRVEVALHGIDHLDDRVHLQMPKVHGLGSVFHPEAFLVRVPCPPCGGIVVDLPPFEEKQVVALDHLADGGSGDGRNIQSRTFLVDKGFELLLAPARKCFSLGSHKCHNPGIHPHGPWGLRTGRGRGQDHQMVVAAFEPFPPHPDRLSGNAKGFPGRLLPVPLVEGEDLHPFLGNLFDIKHPETRNHRHHPLEASDSTQDGVCVRGDTSFAEFYS